MGLPKPAVTFGDVAADVLTSIRTTLNVAAFGSVPNPRPDTFVVAQLAGGTPRTEVSEIARVVVGCWAQTDEDAHDLCQRVRRHLLALVDGTARPNGSMFVTVDITAPPAMVPDPESTQPRFRLTADIHVTAIKETS